MVLLPFGKDMFPVGKACSLSGRHVPRREEMFPFGTTCSVSERHVPFRKDETFQTPILSNDLVQLRPPFERENCGRALESKGLVPPTRVASQTFFSV